MKATVTLNPADGASSAPSFVSCCCNWAQTVCEGVWHCMPHELEEHEKLSWTGLEIAAADKAAVCHSSGQQVPNPKP